MVPTKMYSFLSMALCPCCQKSVNLPYCEFLSAFKEMGYKTTEKERHREADRERVREGGGQFWSLISIIGTRSSSQKKLVLD